LTNFLKEEIMKKIFLVIAIVLTNSVFTACTELEDNLENEPVGSETILTVGEEGEDPEEEEVNPETGN
jgi:hypothetical protein